MTTNYDEVWARLSPEKQKSVCDVQVMADGQITLFCFVHNWYHRLYWKVPFAEIQKVKSDHVIDVYRKRTFGW